MIKEGDEREGAGRRQQSLRRRLLTFPVAGDIAEKMLKEVKNIAGNGPGPCDPYGRPPALPSFFFHSLLCSLKVQDTLERVVGALGFEPRSAGIFYASRT